LQERKVDLEISSLFIEKFETIYKLLQYQHSNIVVTSWCRHSDQ